MPRCAGASLVVVYEIVSPLLIGNSGGDGYCRANAQTLHGADFFAALPLCHTAWAGTSRLLRCASLRSPRCGGVQVCWPALTCQRAVCRWLAATKEVPQIGTDESDTGGEGRDKTLSVCMSHADHCRTNQYNTLLSWQKGGDTHDQPVPLSASARATHPRGRGVQAGRRRED